MLKQPPVFELKIDMVYFALKCQLRMSVESILLQIDVIVMRLDCIHKQ